MPSNLKNAGRPQCDEKMNRKLQELASQRCQRHAK